LLIIAKLEYMARRSEHTQAEIKEMILKAAENIVAEEGVSALKVRRIALDIGYTVGSIYMVFDNMADLIWQLKARVLDDLALELEKVLKKNIPAEECIRQLGMAYLTFAENNFFRWSLIFEISTQDGENVPDWYQQKVEQMFMLIEPLFLQLAPGQSAERAGQAARALWGGVHGVCSLTLTGRLDLEKENENTLMLLIDNFVYGWVQKSL